MTSQFCGDDIVTWVDVLLAKGPRPWCSYHLQKEKLKHFAVQKVWDSNFQHLFHCRYNNHYQNKCISNPKLSYNHYWNNKAYVINMLIFLAHLSRNSSELFWSKCVIRRRIFIYIYIHVYIFLSSPPKLPSQFQPNSAKSIFEYKRIQVLNKCHAYF